MNRIDARFKELQAQGRRALIPYVVAGDPDAAFTVAVMHAAVNAGASLIELGLPFSDPEAEGPVIQLAHERALRGGTTLTRSLELLREFRRRDSVTPVVMMGYLNPLERMGYAAFADAAKGAGADGVLMVNLPPEESSQLKTQLDRVDMRLIFLLSPTTTNQRARMIAQHGNGFLYYVSLKGITGADTLSVKSVEDSLARLRPLTTLPIAVGFGIKTAASARAVAAVADAVVIGAAVVDLIASATHDRDEALRKVAAFIGELRVAIDA